MKKILVFILLCLFAYSAYSQIRDSVSVVSGHSIQLAVPGIRYNYEQAIGRKFSLNYAAGVEYTIISDYFSYFEYTINPILLVEPRYYFNLNKRAAKGKNTYMNSGGFLAVTCALVLPSLSYSDESVSGFAIIPYWGVRRVWYRHLLFELGVGLGIEKSFSYDHVNAAFHLNLKLGYQF